MNTPKLTNKSCMFCKGTGTVSVGTHHFERFGTLKMEADCSICDGTGDKQTKVIVRKKDSQCINTTLRSMSTRRTVRAASTLAV